MFYLLIYWEGEFQAFKVETLNISMNATRIFFTINEKSNKRVQSFPNNISNSISDKDLMEAIKDMLNLVKDKVVTYNDLFNKLEEILIKRKMYF